MIRFCSLIIIILFFDFSVVHAAELLCSLTDSTEIVDAQTTDSPILMTESREGV